MQKHMYGTEELYVVEFGWQNSILANSHLILKRSYLPNKKGRLFIFIQKQGVHLKMKKHIKKLYNSLTSRKIRHLASTGIP